MKFSLGFLLVLTLFIGMLVNLSNNCWKSNILSSQLANVNRELLTNRWKILFADERRLIYERSFQAVEKRKQTFEQAKPRFQEIANKYSVLKIGDPNFIHAVECFFPNETYRKRFKVWIPEKFDIELRFGYHEEKDSWRRQTKLHPSERFEPGDVFRFQLPAGESTFEIAGALDSDEFAVELSVNDKPVHLARFDAAGLRPKGISLSHSSMPDTVSFQPDSRMLLSLDCECENEVNASVGFVIGLVDSHGESKTP